MVGTVDILLEPRPPSLAAVKPYTAQSVSRCKTHTVPHLIITGSSRGKKKRFVADWMTM